MGLVAGIGVAGWAALASTAVSVGASVYSAKQKSEENEQQALYDKDEAAQAAENIMRARRKQVAAARAATAGSGTQLDEFSEINTSDIERGAANDEYITLLSGERRARGRTAGDKENEFATNLSGVGSLLSTGYQVGWKNKQGGR